MYLGHGYYITSDKYQYIVEKRSVLKTGKNAGEEIGRGSSFHPTVYAACNWILRQLQRGDIELKDEPEECVELFKKRLEEVIDMFEKCEHLELSGGKSEDNSEEEPAEES